MSYVSRKIKSRREARKQLVEICEKRHGVFVIHYSCESFCGRITSIAVRNLATAQTRSFSIHQVAERDMNMHPENIEGQYDRLEREILEEFFSYAKNHEDCIWLHWNMRNASYGFEALENRFKIHGEKPFRIPESCRQDVARLLIELYGENYIDHRRLEMLAKKNGISMLDFLIGEEEAEAFNEKRYVALHRSTLRKVDIISDIVVRAADNTLVTDAKEWKLYGSYFAFLMEKAREHPILGVIVAVVSVLGAIASIASCWS